VQHLKGASLSQAPALLANIRLRWKGTPEKNTLAYYEHSQITVFNIFIALSPVPGPLDMYQTRCERYKTFSQLQK